MWSTLGRAWASSRVQPSTTDRKFIFWKECTPIQPTCRISLSNAWHCFPIAQSYHNQSSLQPHHHDFFLLFPMPDFHSLWWVDSFHPHCDSHFQSYERAIWIIGASLFVNKASSIEFPRGWPYHGIRFQNPQTLVSCTWQPVAACISLHHTSLYIGLVKVGQLLYSNHGWMNTMCLKTRSRNGRYKDMLTKVHCSTKIWTTFW